MALATDDIDRFIGRYSLGRDGNPFNTMASPHFLRIKVPGGFLDSKHLRRIAEWTKTYSRGQAEITNRQDIQLHWIDAEDSLEIFSAMDEMGFTTDMCGQGFSGARYGDVRNIVCCPVSGIERNELMNGAPLLKKLNDFFTGNPDFQDMPRKFKISISGCGCDCTRAVINDLALVAVEKNCDVGFTLLVGGSIGSSLPGPRLTQPIGVFVRVEDAFDIAVAIVEIHKDFGSRDSKAKARFKWLIHKWGREKFINILKERLGTQFEEYDGSAFSRDEGHEGVNLQSQNNYYYINVPIMGGILSSDEMISLAELAEEYGNSELRLTPAQNILIPNVKQKDFLLKNLEEIGFPMNGSKLQWNSMGCASDFCGKTLIPHAKDITRELVNQLGRRFDKELLNEAGFRIHVSGCTNNCCANLIAEIGLAGRLTKDLTKQNYTILLGGGVGIKPMMGRQIEENVPTYDLSSRIENLLTNYFRKRNSSENLREFCNRHTVDELKLYLNFVET